jgi:hypothetical protein
MRKWVKKRNRNSHDKFNSRLETLLFKRRSSMPAKDLMEALGEFHDMYESLVWYARREPRDHPSWNENPSGTPAVVHKANNEFIFEIMKGVEERFPYEVERLTSPSTGDFAHGFNSGCLAAFRFFLTALEDEETVIDEDTGEEYSFGGVQNAIEEFPDTAIH